MSPLKSLHADAGELSPRINLAVSLISAYLAVQMISDIASLKIGIVAGLAVDLGTFLYPITFTLRDLVHKAIGKKAARSLVFAAGAINLVMACYLFLTTLIPGDPSWGMDAEWARVLGPVWRIVLASILAEVVSELADTEIYHRIAGPMFDRYGEKHAWIAVLASNGLAVPLDNFIFCGLAFWISLPGSPGLPFSVVAQIFLLNLAVKFGVTLLSLPAIYLIKGRVRD